MAPSYAQPSEKSYVVAVCLSGIFGPVGVHHFYLGRFLEGVIDFGLLVATFYFLFTDQILLAIGFALADFFHTVVTTILLLIGAYKDGHGKIVCYPGQKLKTA